MHRPHATWALLLFACKSSYKLDDDAGSAYADSLYDDTGRAAADEDDGSEADDGYEPEEEDAFAALRPAATRSYVFVANGTRGTVTRIGVPGLDVITAAVGTSPALVETTPDNATAVVFNAGSDDLTILDSASLEGSTVPVRANLNALEMAPDGRWVALFHDRSAEEEDDEAASGAQSFNEVSFVHLDSRTHVPMVVGFDPTGVSFAEDGSKAVVVSDAWLAVIDLTEDPETTTLVPQRIRISEDLVDPPIAEEVVLSPDGQWAFVRQFGTTTLLVVDLITEVVATIEVGANATDLDITPDGLSAVAVARAANQLWLYDLDDPFGAAEVIALPPGVYGSIEMAEMGDKALLFSTASGTARYALWTMDSEARRARRAGEHRANPDSGDPDSGDPDSGDPDSGDPDSGDPAAAADIQVLSLVKPIADVSISPTGNAALIFHTLENSSELDASSPFYDQWALTLLDLDEVFASPLRLEAEPTEYVHADDGSRGFFIMEGQPYLEVLHYDTLLYDEVQLKSKPEHLGVLTGTTTAYVSQEHELGRISFYDAEQASLQTITGFELNSAIERE